MFTKELFIGLRIALSVALAWLFDALTGFEAPVGFVIISMMTIIFSVMWQYLIIHDMLNFIKKQSRATVLFITLFLTFIYMVWVTYSFAVLDVTGSTEAEIFRSIASILLMYVSAASAFVGTACARRAYQKHGGL